MTEFVLAEVGAGFQVSHLGRNRTSDGIAAGRNHDARRYRAIVEKPRPTPTLLLHAMDRAKRELIPSLLAVALAGLTLHGVVAGGDRQHALSRPIQFWLPAPASDFLEQPFHAANLTISYAVGSIAIQWRSVCPAFISTACWPGVRISFLGVTAHALKGLASDAVVAAGRLVADLRGAVALASADGVSIRSGFLGLRYVIIRPTRRALGLPAWAGAARICT